MVRASENCFAIVREDVEDAIDVFADASKVSHQRLGLALLYIKQFTS